MADAYKCQDCDEVFVDEPDSPLYECQNCGARYTRDESQDGISHRCPDCGKFGAKVAELGCPECGQGEVDELFLGSAPGAKEDLKLGDQEILKAAHRVAKAFDPKEDPGMLRAALLISLEDLKGAVDYYGHGITQKAEDLSGAKF